MTATVTKIVKNLQIPFNCRRTYGRVKYSSIGSIALAALPGMANPNDKRDVLLCCYNQLSFKYKDRIENRFHCDFGEVASHQTVFNLDIDKVPYTVEAARMIEEALSEVAKVIVSRSFSGNIHVTIPMNYRILSDSIFKTVAEYLADLLPDCFKAFVDEASYRRKWYWYQSHNFQSWRDAGLINTTKAEQGEKSHFFSDEAALDFGKSFLLVTKALGTCPERLSNRDLARYLHYLFRIILGVNIYGIPVCKDATGLLRRAVAEAVSRRDAGEVLSTIRAGKKAIQRTSEGNVFSGQLNAAVFAIERICGVDAALADRDLGRGGEGSLCVDGDGSEEDDILRFEGDPQESDGDLACSRGGDEASATGGLPDYRSVECVLAFISEFEALLRRQHFNSDSMGNLFPASGVRKHKYRSYQSEEQDHAVFDGVCGQILERYTGQSGTSAAAFVGLYEWFRHASDHLGNLQYGGRSVHEIGNEIARRMRLSDAFSGAGRFQEVREKEANSQEYQNLEHLKELEDLVFEGDWQLRIGPEKYAKRIASFVKNHHDRFLLGLSRMMGFIGAFRTKFRNEKLDIGAQHFEFWFGSKELSCYFRRLILGKLALTSGEYAKGRKTMSWFFLKEVKDVWFPRFEDAFGKTGNASSLEALASRLGEGKTYTELARVVTHLFLKNKGDAVAASKEAFTVLELSSANEKEKRRQDIKNILWKLDKKRGQLLTSVA